MSVSSTAKLPSCILISVSTQALVCFSPPSHPLVNAATAAHYIFAHALSRPMYLRDLLVNLSHTIAASFSFLTIPLSMSPSHFVYIYVHIHECVYRHYIRICMHTIQAHAWALLKQNPYTCMGQRQGSGASSNRRLCSGNITPVIHHDLPGIVCIKVTRFQPACIPYGPVILLPALSRFHPARLLSLFAALPLLFPFSCAPALLPGT